jgi:hypothetical protein
MHQQSLNYNGFSNVETWLANVWLCNDVEHRAIVKEANIQEGGIDAKAAWLAEELEELLQSQFAKLDDSDCNLWTELLASAFSRINWRELVE